tara:strand:+ start:3586 stop:3789 length:204 start_codon:yes stop_codon:yes gene_type:complete
VDELRETIEESVLELRHYLDSGTKERQPDNDYRLKLDGWLEALEYVLRELEAIEDTGLPIPKKNGWS